jgi:tRNA-specific 2-thiouridylase
MGIGGPGEAWFVVAKNEEKNEVVLAQGLDHPALYADELVANELNWLEIPSKNEFRAKTKVRYRQMDQDCLVQVNGDKVRVIFDRPQRAMTPGQSVVFYLGEVCLGGGIITEISASYHELGRELPQVLSV